MHGAGVVVSSRSALGHGTAAPPTSARTTAARPPSAITSARGRASRRRAPPRPRHPRRGDSTPWCRTVGGEAVVELAGQRGARGSGLNLTIEAEIGPGAPLAAPDVAALSPEAPSAARPRRVALRCRSVLEHSLDASTPAFRWTAISSLLATVAAHPADRVPPRRGSVTFRRWWRRFVADTRRTVGQEGVRQVAETRRPIGAPRSRSPPDGPFLNPRGVADDHRAVPPPRAVVLPRRRQSERTAHRAEGGPNVFSLGAPAVVGLRPMNQSYALPAAVPPEKAKVSCPTTDWRSQNRTVRPRRPPPSRERHAYPARPRRAVPNPGRVAGDGDRARPPPSAPPGDSRRRDVHPAVLQAHARRPGTPRSLGHAVRP